MLLQMCWPTVVTSAEHACFITVFVTVVMWLLLRLEVQAEVMATVVPLHSKRDSLSSESANLSIDTKSCTISFGDNVSTKALAGSLYIRLLFYRFKICVDLTLFDLIYEYELTSLGRQRNVYVVVGSWI